jgi:hypothetical protein
MGGIDMSTAALEEILSNMRQVRNGVDYYTVTLLGTPEGKLEWSTLTHWCGFTEDQPPREIRQASLVYPERMIEFWKSAGQDYLVVNIPAELLVFLLFGGNALVEQTIAEEHQPEWVQPRAVTRARFGGFDSLANLPTGALNRAPTPKHRMRVLKRDGFRCRLCGTSPSNHVDVELHVHHILRGA